VGLTQRPVVAGVALPAAAARRLRRLWRRRESNGQGSGNLRGHATYGVVFLRAAKPDKRQSDAGNYSFPEP
jgi:hypothetical protein